MFDPTGQFAERIVESLHEPLPVLDGDRRVRGDATPGTWWSPTGDRGSREEFRDRVFQIFQQLDPDGEGREGSGLGLALCRKIVERHGGRIWIESGPGEGSDFHYNLDLEPGHTTRET